MKKQVRQLAKSVARSVAGRYGPHTRDGREPQLWVLMYHRILPRSDARYALEEPGMKVTPDTFAMHLREIRRYFQVVALDEWLAAWRRGDPLPKRACAVTFDDGWRDNYEYVLPLLEAHRVPATLFAVAEKIGTDFQFWPNIVAALMRQGSGPELAQQPLFDVPGMREARPDLERVARCIALLKRQSDEALLDSLEAWDWRSRLDEPMEPALMNWEQLGAMQRSGWVTVGSHTCSHRRLTPGLSTEPLRHEIRHSRAVLEERLDVPVPLFCFPNGDYSPEALSLVRAGYEAAVTTQRGINRHATLEPHELQRIGVHEDSTDTPQKFRSRLSGWL